MAALLPDLIVMGESVTNVGLLIFLIAYGGVALSLLAGYVTAAVKGDDATGAVRILAGFQMALGLFFEITGWALTPVWYHVVFLICIIPMTLAGGKLRAG